MSYAIELNFALTIELKFTLTNELEFCSDHFCTPDDTDAKKNALKLLREHAPASVLYSGIPCTLFASTKVEDMERDVHKEHTCSFPLGESGNV